MDIWNIQYFLKLIWRGPGGDWIDSQRNCQLISWQSLSCALPRTNDELGAFISSLITINHDRCNERVQLCARITSVKITSLYLSRIKTGITAGYARGAVRITCCTGYARIQDCKNGGKLGLSWKGFRGAICKFVNFCGNLLMTILYYKNFLSKITDRYLQIFNYNCYILL